MIEYDIFRPVRISGIALIIAGVCGALLQISLLNDPEFDNSFNIFVTTMSVWHLITGLGVLSQKYWGYILLKFYLYFMLLVVPIGTYYGLKALRYLKENEVSKFYSGKSIILK
jgi:hypothetical protein